VFQGDHPDTASAHRDGLPGFHLDERDGPGLALPGIDDDAAIHLRAVDRYPARAQADEGLQVGGGVELLGEDPVGGRGFHGHVVLLEDLRAMLLKVVQDEFQRLRVDSTDAKHGA